MANTDSCQIKTIFPDEIAAGFYARKCEEDTGLPYVVDKISPTLNVLYSQYKLVPALGCEPNDAFLTEDRSTLCAKKLTRSNSKSRHFSTQEITKRFLFWTYKKYQVVEK